MTTVFSPSFPHVPRESRKSLIYGAGNRVRTGDLDLGKLPADRPLTRIPSASTPDRRSHRYACLTPTKLLCITRGEA